MTVFLIIIGIILSLNIISLIVNKVFFAHELDGISPYGELVEIDNQSMHVYSMGEGDKTIVLLPGLGVPLPSADFGPLMRELSKDFTVVCIEYYGYGFSDETTEPRTNENYTEETRMALSNAGFEPPYILMPHSASGIYSEYYAIKYPDEIVAIIMLDTTSSAVEDTKVPRFVYQLVKIQQMVGFNRIIGSVAVPLMLKEENGYTKKEIGDYRKFFNHVNNNTIINQNIRFYDNVLEVMRMEFPNGVPVLKIVPTGTIKQTEKDYQTNHLGRLGANAKSITLDGTHFIYHTRVADICEVSVAFLYDIK